MYETRQRDNRDANRSDDNGPRYVVRQYRKRIVQRRPKQSAVRTSIAL